MIGCVVSLLLINTFYCSLGNPVNESYSPLSKSIQLLASSCENLFLATQIKNKIDACNFPVTAIGMLESKFECFIFYDINSQLCAAYRGSKQDLSQMYASRINEVQKVQVTCDLAKNWKFIKLTEFPMYNMSERLFKTQVTCLKACGVEDLLSEDTNFYCKYYQWGTEMLQHLITSSPLTGNMPSGDSGPESALVETPPKFESSSAPVSLNNTTSALVNTNVHPEAIQSNLALSNLESNNNIKLDTASSINAGQPGPNVIKDPKKHVPPLPNTGEAPSQNVNEIQANPKLKGDVDLDDDNEREFDPDDEPSPESQQINDGGDTGIQSDPKLEHENPIVSNVNKDPDDEPSPEGQQINGGVDTRIQSDPNHEHGKNKKNDAASIASNVNIDMSHKVPEFNPLPDGFAEDDDHFFSFFLTAIIVIIFLYVLYHNKSKFRKVILGLLVEGRQSGRRRNSRGHEYRRLDTLEQAMSTNSAAPPSKIIY